MALYASFAALVRRCLVAGLAFFFVTATPVHAAQSGPAANSADWWVYVANDQSDKVRELLARGADPNVRYKNGQPAIMRAVVDNAWKVFDLLAADKRTDLNIQNPAQETPLMYLAVAGQADRARALIERGAQVNRLGWTPLHYAASKGHVDVARLLLARKAMVNAPAPDGTTPLMMAAYSGSREMVQLLLKAGADPTTRNLKGQNAADWALTANANALAQDLAQVIARAHAAREAMRGKENPAPAAGPVPQDEAPAPPVTVPDAAPATRGDSEQDAPQGGVRGLSGVGTDHDELPSGN